ncbi:hypothetical protein Pan216_26350 [Planctomycetes bacterium Pan216]|uniref:TfoX N-terminal domain-containing protein n=1 Tax=Kolteria novifilia TaxID=2527975 RepID=A0A518B461_9BACT|nr:hypothetical protein Pan216_26350 [Planctomycetes bacterium Pan216]
MAYDEQLVDRVRKVLARRKSLVEKKMFGGIGFLLHGNMCCGVRDQYLLLRLGLERAEQALFQPHVREFNNAGRIIKGWVIVESDGLATDNALEQWVRDAVAFVVTLPPK